MATFDLTFAVTLQIDAVDEADAEAQFNSMGDLLNHDNLNKADFKVTQCDLENISDSDAI